MDLPPPVVPISDLDLREVIFSWDDPGSGRRLHFLADRIEKHILDNPGCAEAILMAIQPEFAKTLPRERGLERHRLERIPIDASTWTPAIVCHLPDGTGLIIDGSHRYYVAFKCGYPFMKAWYVPQEIWSLYLADLPTLGDVREGFSGIL